MIKRDYFNRFKTRKYQDEFFIKRFLIKNFLKNVDKLFDSCRAKKVLEVGCGEGFVLGYLSLNHPDINFSGFDNNEKELKKLNDIFPNIKTFKGDILQDNFREKYDIVLMLEVLEHLKEPENALKNLKQLTDQYVIISVPWEPFFRISNLLAGKNISRLGNDPEHINHWSKRKIINLLRKYFKISKVKISFPWVIILAQKY